MFQDTVVRAGEMIAGVVDGLDPDAVSGSTARELWAGLDRAERLCAAGKTLLARRVAATHQRTGGTRSAAEELARRSGSSTGAAKDSLETSQRLPEQAPVEQALRRGELSLAQAALVSAAAAANPVEAPRLTELAKRVSLPELREECARVRAAADPDPEATNRRLHHQRRLRRWTDGEGFWNLHAKGSPQAGAAFNAVLDALTDERFRTAYRAGLREPLEAYAFDALMRLADPAADPADRRAGNPSRAAAESGRTAGQPGRSGGQPDGTATTADQPAPTAGQPGHSDDHAGSALTGLDGDGTSPTDGAGTPGVGGGSSAQGGRAPTSPASARRGRVNPRFLALLRVDVAALRRGRVDGDELCEIRGVGPVPVSVAEGLLGQAVLHLVITDGVDVVNVTHLGRGPTAAQKIALAWASPGCTVEGCWRTRVEHDHREPWAETKHTRLDELDPLCAFHHDLKTRCGWALVPGTGKRTMVPPDDPRHPGHQQPRPTGSRTRPRPTGPNPADGPNPPTRSSSARRAGRRRAAANTQTTLPDPPGDPPAAA
jgi:hypothetical protein